MGAGDITISYGILALSRVGGALQRFYMCNYVCTVKHVAGFFVAQIIFVINLLDQNFGYLIFTITYYSLILLLIILIFVFWLLTKI